MNAFLLHFLAGCVHTLYMTHVGCPYLRGWWVGGSACPAVPYQLPHLITHSVGPTTIPNYLRYPTIMTLPCTGKPACPATPHSQLSLRWDSDRTIKEGAVVNTGMSFILPIIWIGLVKIIPWEKWRYHTFTILSFLTEKLKALRLFFASVNISWIWLCWRRTTSLTYECTEKTPMFIGSFFLAWCDLELASSVHLTDDVIWSKAWLPKRRQNQRRTQIDDRVEPKPKSCSVSISATSKSWEYDKQV